ncbi:MAG: DUF1801 domain-containing protein [Acidimicrobiia bacterium]|nr:MAG: DUF1801 domain-containing protein [Acidimicrobiia bacterium]
MRSEATSVEQYLDELPADRREAIETVRDTIVDNLPAGHVEGMNWGMIAYSVPLETYPDTYNRQPLLYAALANQKNHMAVYLTGVYADQDRRENFLDKYRETGKRLDMGKSCVRFRRIEDLAVDLIGDTIAETDVGTFIELYEASR